VPLFFLFKIVRSEFPYSLYYFTSFMPVSSWALPVITGFLPLTEWLLQRGLGVVPCGSFVHLFAFCLLSIIFRQYNFLVLGWRFVSSPLFPFKALLGTVIFLCFGQMWALFHSNSARRSHYPFLSLPGSFSVSPSSPILFFSSCLRDQCKRVSSLCFQLSRFLAFFGDPLFFAPYIAPDGSVVFFWPFGSSFLPSFFSRHLTEIVLTSSPFSCLIWVYGVIETYPVGDFFCGILFSSKVSCLRIGPNSPSSSLNLSTS